MYIVERKKEGAGDSVHAHVCVCVHVSQASPIFCFFMVRVGPPGTAGRQTMFKKGRGRPREKKGTERSRFLARMLRHPSPPSVERLMRGRGEPG